MEKKLLTKKSISLILIIFFSSAVFAQQVSFEKKIRIPMWAEVDAYPGLELESEETEGFAYPKASIKKVAPFILSGMVYGWNFEYTPSDKARGVEEYFEVTEIVTFNADYESIMYSDPWIKENLLNVWVEYNRSEAQINNYKMWSSIKNPVIQGEGYGDLELGFEGMEIAAKEALKDAVRTYYRNVIKNKPKAITGSVLIRNTPIIGIKSGQYSVNLDFFLECGKIIEYKVY